nr:hypothetical protein [Corallococcus sp. CA049B]
MPVVLRGHTDEIKSAAFSPDGERVVTASWDGTARVWRADGTGMPVVLRGHTEGITSAAFSPDGERVVTASVDGTARVWRADGKDEPVVLRGAEKGILSAAFSPDGQWVVTVSTRTARIWPVTVASIQQALREDSTKCLTPELRKTYLYEVEKKAQKNYEACERSFGRTPQPAPAS